MRSKASTHRDYIFHFNFIFLLLLYFTSYLDQSMYQDSLWIENEIIQLQVCERQDLKLWNMKCIGIHFVEALVQA